jgi:colicin import membrane protein
MRFTSFVLSLLIHVLVLALGLYFPFQGEGLTIDLDRPVYEVELVKMPQSKPAPEPEKSKTVPKKPKASKPSPKDTPPKPKSKPTRLAAKAPRKQQAPKPTQIARKSKQPAKPAPAKKKSAPEPPEKKKLRKPEKSAPPPPTKEEVLSRALGDIEKGMDQKEDAEQVVAKELASLKKELSRQQPAGSSGQGTYHIEELYGRIVEQKIKESWRYPQMGQGSNLSAEISIRVDSSGEITQFSLQRRSGRSDFDNSVLRAVEETGKLPPPPSREIRAITITFNLQEQAG